MGAGQSDKVIAIIQARMESTRFPFKVLMPLPFNGDTSILGHIVKQLRKSRFTPEIIVATSTNKSDDEIETFCLVNNVLVYRGDEVNVHSRYLQILNQSPFKTALRVTGDNPIIDVEYLDLAIQKHVDTHSDYSFSTDLPVGMNFEIFDVKAFNKMSAQALSVEEKEHVTLRFKSDASFKKNLVNFDLFFQKKIRVTIDYPTDYLVVSFLFDLSIKHGIEPSIKLIQFVLRNYPWLLNINEDNFQKKQFISTCEEIDYAISILNNLELRSSAKYLSTYAKIPSTK